MFTTSNIILSWSDSTVSLNSVILTKTNRRFLFLEIFLNETNSLEIAS